MAHRMISSDSEEEYDAPIQHRPIRSSQIIDSTNESEDSDNPDINSFSSSASSDIYSEPESSLNASLSPIQVTRKTKSKQRTILSDDEEESDSQPHPQPNEGRKPTSSKVENESTLENNSVCSEASNSEVNSPGDEQREVSKETNKENTSPLPQNLPPEKPMAKPTQGHSQATPVNQMQVMPAKELPQPVLIPATQNQVPQYQLAHTRPALLKQLDNVKVSIFV